MRLNTATPFSASYQAPKPAVKFGDMVVTTDGQYAQALMTAMDKFYRPLNRVMLGDYPSWLPIHKLSRFVQGAFYRNLISKNKDQIDLQWSQHDDGSASVNIISWLGNKVAETKMAVKIMKYLRSLDIPSRFSYGTEPV